MAAPSPPSTAAAAAGAAGGAAGGVLSPLGDSIREELREEVSEDGPPEFEGWLHKKGYRKNKAWKERFFVLRNGRLRYYVKPSHVISEQARGEVSLLNAQVAIVYGKDSRKKGKFPFKVSPADTEREYDLYAATPDLREQWKVLLEATVEWNSRDIEQKAQYRRRSTQNSVPLSLNVHVSTDFLAQAGVASTLSMWRKPLALRGVSGRGVMSSLSVADDVSAQTLDPSLRLKHTACMAVHNQSNFLAVGNDKYVQLVRVPSTQSDMLLTRRFMQTGGCVDLCWRDDRLLCSSFGDKMYLYRAEPQQSSSGGDDSGESNLLATFTHPAPTDSGLWPGHWHPSSRVRRVRQHMDGTTLLSLYRNDYNLWDANRTIEPYHWNRGDSAPLFAADWNPHAGGEFVIGGARRCIKVLDDRALRSSKERPAWKVSDAHDDVIRDLAWSPMVEHWIASAGDDGLVRLWDRRYGERPVRTLQGHNNRVTCVAWSRSHCEIVLSGDCDGTMRLWNARVAPHFVMHRENHETDVVGCGFSSVNCLQFFGATRDGRVVRDELSIDFLSCYAPSLSDDNKEIETLMYVRDFSSAFKLLSARATRLWEDGRTDEAAHLLKLCSTFTFSELADDPDLSSFSKVVSELSYYVPPRALLLSTVEESDRQQIQLLKVREALFTFVKEGKYREITQLQDEVCSHIERNGDAFGVSVLKDMLKTTYDHDYASALKLACAICASLKSAKLFANFLEIATMFLVPTVTPLSGDMDEDPKLVLSQLELMRDLNAVVQRPDAEARVIDLIQAYPDKRRIMSREVHMLYLHALLARHNYDVLFIWASSLVRSFSRGAASDFAETIQTLLRDKAFPQFKAFLERSIEVNPRHPWDSSDKIRSVLTATNVLSNAESLDKAVVDYLGDCLGRLSRALCDALREMMRHPNYESVGVNGRADAAERIRKVLTQFEFIGATRARKTSYHSERISATTAALTRLLHQSERSDDDDDDDDDDGEG